MEDSPGPPGPVPWQQLAVAECLSSTQHGRSQCNLQPSGLTRCIHTAREASPSACVEWLPLVASGLEGPGNVDDQPLEYGRPSSSAQ